MGISSDGIICYGYLFEEGYDLPWTTDDDHDIDAWWERENGYVELPLNPDPYDEEGNHQPWFAKLHEHERQKILQPIWEHHEDWKKTCPPLPVELVNYCSYDSPMYILAIPGTVLQCSRGNPESLPVGLMEKPGVKDLELFLKFMDKYHILDNEEWEGERPKLGWWLASFMG